MRSDKQFFEFLRRGGGRYALIALLGVVLLLLCGVGIEPTADATVQTEEERICEMCSLLDGVGECRVMLSRDGERVVAVTVLCDGADSVATRARITDMLSSFYGIGANRISVLKITDKKV